MRLSIEAEVQVGVEWDGEAQTFVASVPSLRLYSQGVSEPEAFRAAASAVRLYLVAAFHGEVLADILALRGFAPRPVGAAPVPADGESVRITTEHPSRTLVDCAAAPAAPVPPALTLRPAPSRQVRHRLSRGLGYHVRYEDDYNWVLVKPEHWPVVVPKEGPMVTARALAELLRHADRSGRAARLR